VNISVENLTSVDKKIILEADSTDLAPKIESALRGYSKTMNFPGFRPGKAPMALVKKRIGKEVEGEQIDKFVQEVFQDKIVPEYKPIGEPLIDKLDYTDGKLYVEFKIGVVPQFDLIPLSELTIDKLVHDVTEEEVQKEYEFTLRRESIWAETDDAATKDSKVTLDVVKLDADGNPTEDHDHDLPVDLANDNNKEYAAALVGKKKGDVTTIVIEENGEKLSYQATVKKIESPTIPELDEEFFKKASREQATNEEDMKTYLKSQIQNYFDQTAEDLFFDKIAGELIDRHEFEIPETMFNSMLLDRMRKLAQENNDKLPEDFNEEAFKDQNRESIFKEAKWTFIISALMEKYPDVEITPEDVDAYFDAEAAKMGLPAEMLKNFYASQSSQLENLRMRIRTNKLFSRLSEEVTVSELSKEDFEAKYSKK
jgi:trigger factor